MNIDTQMQPDSQITLDSLGGDDSNDLPFSDEEIAGVAPALAESNSDSNLPDTSLPSNHYSPGVTSGLEEKAMNLLGSGIAAESVASALGVTPGRIAQLLSKDAFSEEVARLRYASLQSHNVRDGKYDSLEDRLLGKLEKSLPLMMKPETILNALTRVNAAKRRGQSTPEQVVNQQNIINLTLPTVIADKFSLDINNQVVKAGEQELLTMPSGNLLKQVEDAQNAQEANGTAILEDKSNVQEEGS